MARWRRVDRIAPDGLRELGSSVEARLDEAADYIEHLEDEIADRDERIEELEEQVRDLQQQLLRLEEVQV